MMVSTDKIKVLIVDDHQVVRQGLRTFLELHDDIAVVGEAGDGSAAVEMIRRLEPDVVLMDLVMPGLDGVAATRQVTSLYTRTRVIALTSFAEDDKVFPAIEAGASSYLLKDVSPDALVEAIRAVYRGEARLHPDIARKLMHATRVAHQASGEAPALAGDLTDREREVIRLVARGCSNHEIAQSLVISEKTVKTHLTNIFDKLKVNNRFKAALLIMERASESVYTVRRMTPSSSARCTGTPEPATSSSIFVFPGSTSAVISLTPKS